MSFKIKLFSATQNNLSSLENEVNTWMTQNSDFNVKDIKVTYSDHNILMTLIYDSPGRSLQTVQMPEAKPAQSFQETLSAYAPPRQEPKTSTPTQPSSAENIAAAIDALNPSSVKPGRLIQNNYSKYNKSNQTVSEDQAFNWD
jgi:hypothetical protein